MLLILCRTKKYILARVSGKLVLLDKLLPKLKFGGHFFTQFKIMLDIIENNLNFRHFKLKGIDGFIIGKKRQIAIYQYQVRINMTATNTSKLRIRTCELVRNVSKVKTVIFKVIKIY